MKQYEIDMGNYRLDMAKYEKDMEDYLNAKESREEARLASMYSPREIDAIKSNRIFIGMSERALIESWGMPEDINTTTTVYGVDKQYCYPNYTFVYVENGVITTIQN